MTITVPILSVEQPQKSAVRFNVHYRGAVRYYLGKWDGEALTGSVAPDPAGTQSVATFELRPPLATPWTRETRA